MANLERTFFAIKQDGVQRRLVDEIISASCRRGVPPLAMKFFLASEEPLKQRYTDLKGRPFFPGLTKSVNSGPVVAMEHHSWR
ncbi:nucleoside diphosphate kinase B-like [Saimiri boliviensis]|uniref:nucleoside diphosphate kinase B-like n=1 Tax=Saimiri boliviensis TaxID=27679 RepID=UPI003D77613A